MSEVRPFIPQDKPKFFVVGVLAGLIGLASGLVAFASASFGFSLLKTLSVVVFIVLLGNLLCLVVRLSRRLLVRPLRSPYCQALARAGLVVMPPNYSFKRTAAMGRGKLLVLAAAAA